MRRSWFRTVLFQIHLWGGLILGIYAFLIGLTGSVLVFHEELAEQIAPEPRRAETGRAASLDEIRARINAAFPDWHVFSLQPPKEPGRPWTSYLLRAGKGRLIFADSQGNVTGERNLTGTWLQLVEQFHSNLLIRGGRLYNGVAGLLVAVLAVTGAVLWWPRRGEWASAFRIVRRANWKGITYDLHRVGGALTFAFAVLFCITGAYFTWPAVYRQIIGAVLPVSPRPGPTARIQAGLARRPLDALVASAQRRVPEGILLRVLMPQSATQPVRIVFRHGRPDENRKTSHIAVNPYTGEVTGADMYAEQRTGDHLVSMLSPLHTGHFGGLPVKLIWALAGLAMPALFVTGFVMWWNRVLVPRARRRTSREPVEARIEAISR
ncbi:MAG TPA: PepSY-associated TM helix domain-containing protein [Bryobacteraceae bacterium]|nr:PepSY-associated TM helix domain-containing protein [Bryobacteraceae bacterium]